MYLKKKHSLVSLRILGVCIYTNHHIMRAWISKTVSFCNSDEIQRNEWDVKGTCSNYHVRVQKI